MYVIIKYYIHLYVKLGVHGGGLDVLGGAARVVARPPAAPRQHRPPRLLAVQRRLAHPVVGADVHQVQVRELQDSRVGNHDLNGAPLFHCT